MGTHPIFESDFDCLTVMDRRYEPFTLSIDNREPFQITRPNEMNIMSDIDQRIADTDRRMAELAEKEARLYAEEERYMAPTHTHTHTPNPPQPRPDPPNPTQPYTP